MPVISLKGLTAKQLRQAATIRERIDDLEKQLAAILGSGGGGGGEVEVKPKRQMSAAARAKIAAAQKRRWARAKGASS
ncbi:MAG: hypothetical protein RI897_1303 [Verrucomicrobiota bacterium]|jgi:hypothetical protein